MSAEVLFSPNSSLNSINRRSLSNQLCSVSSPTHSILPSQTSLDSTVFPLFATSNCSPPLCFLQTFYPFPRGQAFTPPSMLGGPGDDVTYLWMTLIRPGAAWLSSKEKSWSSLLSFFLSSLISCCGPPCQTVEPAASCKGKKTGDVFHLLSAFVLHTAGV